MKMSCTRAEQKEMRRIEILSAGLDLFIRNGFVATKIKDIANKVGMSVGLLFHYFESKEKLYEELIKIGIEGPMSIVSLKEIEPFDFFEIGIGEIFKYAKRDDFTAKMFVLMNQAYFNESIPNNIKEMLKDFDIHGPTVEYIKKGQENGSIKEGNPYALSVVYWSAINGTISEIAINPDIPWPETDWILDIIRRK